MTLQAAERASERPVEVYVQNCRQSRGAEMPEPIQARVL